MPIRWKRITAAVLILSTLATLTGCWDNREIDKLFILTGTALDVAADDPNKISVTLQVANIKQGEAGSGEANTGGSTTAGGNTKGGNAAGASPVILLNAVSDSLLGGVTEMNRSSNHKLLFQHNQIRIFGIELAERGVKKHLDLLLRDQQPRLEVPLAVVDGRAEEALTAKLSQEPITGIFMGGMFEDLSEMSEEYRVRLIDFVQRLLDGTAAPVMPIIKVTDGIESQEIKLEGMAVFKDDRMIGRLSNDETLGYIFSFGEVQRVNMAVTDGSDRAVLHVTSLDCQREITLRPDGGVKVDLSVNSVLGVREMYGFKGMKAPELLKRLETLAQEEIKRKITDCFRVAQGMKADVFEFCTEVYKKYPQQWGEMESRWDEIFTDIDFNVQAKVSIPGTGQIVESLEMEESNK